MIWIFIGLALIYGCEAVLLEYTIPLRYAFMMGLWTFLISNPVVSFCQRTTVASPPESNTEESVLRKP